MYLKIFHLNLIFKVSKSSLNLAEDTVGKVENTLEDVTQNETQNDKGRNMKEKIRYIQSKVRKLITVQERMKQR